MKPSGNQHAASDHLSMKIAGWLGFSAHPIYYLVWTYLIPQPYDNLFLRLFSSLLAIPLIFADFWPQRLRKWPYPYWQFKGGSGKFLTDGHFEKYGFR